MIIAPSLGFVLLSVPKVASTSVDEALAGFHEELPGPPTAKHQNVTSFHRRTVPRIRVQLGVERDAYEVVALFRDPVAWLESWWRYRQRPHVRDNKAERYTGDRSFAEFVELFLTDKEAAGISGRPARFIAGDADSGARLDRLFDVDRPEVWTAWFAERTGSPLEVPQRNRSSVRPPVDLPDALASDLRDWFAPEYDVVDHLAQDGQWAPPAGYRPPGLD